MFSTPRLSLLLPAAGMAASLVLGCGSPAKTVVPVDQTPPLPVFVPASGTYTTPQTVTLSDTEAGALIYYSTDPTMPGGSTFLYTAPIPVSASTTLYAIASSSGFYSNVNSSSYTFNIAPVPAPLISPSGGSFTAATTVTLSDTVNGAKIYYTVDGSTPTSLSTLYTQPLTISAVGTSIVKALAVAANYPDSSVASATFTLAYPASTTPSYAYKNVQIVGGGFVDGLYFHPGQRGLMYAKTDIGGVYRWNKVNGGDTQWTPLLDQFGGRYDNGFYQGSESLALDPGDPTKLYLVLGEYTEYYDDAAVVLISSDMGKTFTTVPLGIKAGSNDIGRNIGERLVVDPNNGQHLYFGTRQNGLYESTDGAHTWAQVAAFPVSGPSSNLEDPEVGVIFENFVASSGTAANGRTKTIYIGVSSPTIGLYMSNDGGVTFSAVNGQPAGYYPNAYSFDKTHKILYLSYGVNTMADCSPYCDHSGPFGPNDGKLYAYTLPSAGATGGSWKEITPPQTTPSGGSYAWGSIVVDPNAPNVVMATTLNKYYPAPYDDIFRSVDFGATWVNIGTNMVRDISLSPWVSFGSEDANGALIGRAGNWLNHLVIDPFDSDHVMMGNGQTVWATDNMSAADGVPTSSTVTNHGRATDWAIGAQGIEETAVNALVSPPSGPAHLLSQMADLGGFTHLDLDLSPVAGIQTGPLLTSGTGVDFAQSNPLIMARVGTSDGSAGTPGQAAGSLLGGYSLDGGLTWTQFPSNPAGVVTGGGTVAVTADGAAILWMPSDPGVAAAYSTDHGTTWTASTGGPAQISSSQQVRVYADRVNVRKLYLFDPDATLPSGESPIYVSVDGGHTFALASTPATYSNFFAVSPAAEGDVWLGGPDGLSHSTDSGVTMAQVPGTAASFGLGFGMPAPGSTYPAIYMIGEQTADSACSQVATNRFTLASECFYRSVDGGATFIRINDIAHQFGSASVITGDPRVFGRFYVGTQGRGIVEGDSPN